jgi:deoxycytidylate deaminase
VPAPRGAAHCNERRTRWLDGEDRGAVYPNACAGAGAASGVDLDACEAIHAEQNALVQCRDVGSVRACYVTVLPCVSCAKLLLSTGCRRVVYAEDYPQREAVERLLLCVGRMTTKRMEGE